MTDELREVYEWHDGISRDSGHSFFGIYQFMPLEDLAKSRQVMNQQLTSATVLQRTFYWVVCGHRKNWIDFFPDGAGDGYYVDPTRDPIHGAVFYNFNETGDYRFYPALSSLLLAISQCYDAGLYDDGNDPASISVIKKEHAIHGKFGSANSP